MPVGQNSSPDADELIHTKQETLKHRVRVRHFMTSLITELAMRTSQHDRSKDESPEVEIFAEYTPKLKGLTYGSDEYRQCLAEMKPALDHHYAENRHHPEHAEMSESWVPVAGYEYYQVSNMGRVMRVEHMVERSNGRSLNLKERLVKSYVTPKGYLRVQLKENGQVRNHLVHRLVMESFHGDPPSEKHQVNHLDGRKTNNSLTNLEWVTQSENLQHAYDEGLKKAGVKYAVTCLEKDITTLGIDKMVKALEVQGVAANAGCIWGCINGKQKKHAGLTFVGYTLEEGRYWVGVNDMTLADVAEMLCDWMAATERHADGDIYKSLEHNLERFGLSEQLYLILKNTVTQHLDERLSSGRMKAAT